MDIALIGCGGVSKAFIRLLIQKKDFFRKKNINIKIKYIIKSDGGIYNSEGIDLELLTKFLDSGKNICEYCEWNYKVININAIIRNKDVDTLVELTNTNLIDGEPGFTHMKLALENGINVITGNKGPILLKYRDLKNIAIKNNVQLAIGCTVGGALPSITAGLFDISGAEVISIQGILNGTSNYILTEMYEREIPYEKALKNAKAQGIVEANPKLDVEGFDTASKILILANVLMEEDLSLKDISIEGITNISREDILKAKSLSEKIKLIGKIEKSCGKVEAKVKLERIKDDHPLYFVDGKNKGLVYNTDTLGDISLIGGASGTINAAASILRDILNIYNGIKYIIGNDEDEQKRIKR